MLEFYFFFKSEQYKFGLFFEGFDFFDTRERLKPVKGAGRFHPPVRRAASARHYIFCDILLIDTYENYIKINIEKPSAPTGFTIQPFF